eukprot:TRINITY_DN145_c0_g1_i1.p1 TRINITY_DN145_c0_g1~~TRINITY_DN145_c0_g1_i1.p1  ORF type:complete len:193 (+),score=40.76 TRINITY_DN145_c0_g1_i1:3132-3710(+)
MKRVNSSSSTDSELYVPPEDNRSNTSKAQSKHQNSCWYYLRRYKKKLREVYANDMQMAFNRGFKEGKESSEVRTLVKLQYQQGHAQGMYNGLVRVIHPTIPIAPSPYTPNFVISLLKETQTEFTNLRKKQANYQVVLTSALRDGTFKVKPVRMNVALKFISIFKAGRRKRKRNLFEETISEIEQLKKILKST